MKESPMTKKEGFTLIETVVAAFIGGLLVASISALLTNSTYISRNASRKLEALHGARSAMEYLTSLDYNDTLLTEGTWSLAAVTNSTLVLGARCDYTIVESGRMKQITVQVPWTSLFTGENQVEMTSLLSKALHN